MAFSYSGITNYGKVSLPSVESWGANNNILRDPPRSITTRRKDKVSDNSFFTQELQDSGDRIAEVISAYPRGINPMVGVSYGNSNGGIGKGQALLYHGQQAKLPYRVMQNGAFRPPILAPVDLLPLSRMPRNTTCVNPTIFNPNFLKKADCSHEKRAITNRRPRTNCPSSFYMKVEKSVPVSAVHALKNPLKCAVDGKVKFLRDKDQHGMYTTTFIKQNSLQGSIPSAYSGKKIFATPAKVDLKSTVKEKVLQGSVPSARNGRRVFTVPSKIDLKDRTILRGSQQSTLSGLANKFMRPETQERVRESVTTECFSQPNGGYTKYVAPEIIENAPTKNIHYSFSTPATSNHASKGAEMRDNSTPSSYSIQKTGSLLLPDTNNRSVIPSMERSYAQPRMRVIQSRA